MTADSRFMTGDLTGALIVLTEDRMRRVESAMLPDGTGNEAMETEERRTSALSG